MKIGKNMRNCLSFAQKYANEWNSFAKDRATQNAIKRLTKLNLVEINEFHQFRLKVTKPQNIIQIPSQSL